jgi:hypothetical protein
MGQELTKIKTKQWIIPTVMGISIVLALVLGMWGTTKYLTHQLQQIVEQGAMKKQVEAYSQIKKTYKSQIEMYQKPSLWETNDGTWIIELEK